MAKDLTPEQLKEKEDEEKAIADAKALKEKEDAKAKAASSKTSLQKYDIVIKDGKALGKYIETKKGKMILQYASTLIEVEPFKIKKRIVGPDVTRVYI